MGRETTVWIFPAINWRNLIQEDLLMNKKKGNLLRETVCLLIAAQYNAIRTKCVKAKIDKTLQNSKCRLCSDSNETINHIINESKKLAKKDNKTTHDWMGKVIHWE